MVEVSEGVLLSSEAGAIEPPVELEAEVFVVLPQDPVHPHPFVPHLLAGPPVILPLISFQVPVSAEGL